MPPPETPASPNSPSPGPGIVTALYIAPDAAAPMVAVATARAVADRGLVGDRYGERRGSGTGWDECQVTLIADEDLDAAAAEFGVAVGNGQHRRNIVLRGLGLDALIGRRFRIGTAWLEYDRPRPPCRWIAQLTEARMTEALAGRGGLCARVIASGEIRLGDEVEIA